MGKKMNNSVAMALATNILDIIKQRSKLKEQNLISEVENNENYKTLKKFCQTIKDMQIEKDAMVKNIEAEFKTNNGGINLWHYNDYKPKIYTKYRTNEDYLLQKIKNDVLINDYFNNDEEVSCEELMNKLADKYFNELKD